MSANDDTILARLKTQNVRGFVSDMGAAAKSVLGFATANEEAAVKTRLSWVEQRAMQQTLYTARRYAFYATTALGALTVASIKSGITFDENKRQGVDAFTATLGSVQAARREVNLLTADTHLVGVGLGELARDAETMQSFGFTIKDVNTDILTLANYAQRAHVPLNSIVEIFDRIQQKGSFTSLDLRALTSLGIPALQIFQRELHLTAAQMQALQNGKLIIPSRYALPALQHGLAQRADVLGTNIGQQLGTTRSYLSQIFGTGESGLFGFMTKGLEHVNALLGRAASGQQRGGIHGLLLGLDSSGTALRFYQTLAGVVHAVGDAFGFAWKLAYPFRVLLLLLGGATYGLATHTGLLSLALKVLAFWWITSRSLMVAYAIGTKAVAAAMFLYRVAAVASTVATLFFTDATFTATDALAAFNLTLLANPITWIVIGLAALAIGVYEVYTHFDQLRRVAENVWDWLTKISRITRLDIVLNFRIGRGGKIASLLLDSLPGIGQIHSLYAGLSALPGLAGGGNLWPGGDAVVGERGPELLSNRGGVARVTPLTSSIAAGGAMGGLTVSDLVAAFREAIDGLAVKADGVKIGEVVASAKRRQEAFA